jgi:L-histidine N-alpha-methyltransferase
MALASLRVDVYLTPGDRVAALRKDVLRGLTSDPKELPAKWFYNDRGSALFEEITRLPEYYLTSRERSILLADGTEIAGLTGAETLIELGSGSADKTGILLRALAEAGSFRRYVPFDVSEQALRDSAARIAGLYPDIEVHGVVGDFERHLPRLPQGLRRLVAFLGSSIGNLVGAERSRFLGELRAGLGSGDAFLLGTDLVKDPSRIEAAYNDAAGVTIEFNRNVLGVVNRELGGDFVLDRFEHVARFDREQEWMDIRLRSAVEQTVTVKDIDLRIVFEQGEEMRTEISDKFRRPELEAELGAASFELAGWWTDPDGDFAVSLWLPA